MIEKVKKHLESQQYKVITAYNIEEQQQSCIAVNVVSVTNLNHTGCNDYQIEMQIIGFTFSEQDKSAKIRNEMAEYVQNKIKSFEDENLAGLIFDSVQYSSDQSIHSFTVKISLYICNN